MSVEELLDLLRQCARAGVDDASVAASLASGVTLSIAVSSLGCDARARLPRDGWPDDSLSCHANTLRYALELLAADAYAATQTHLEREQASRRDRDD